MGCLVVSVLNESGARQLSAGFPSHKTAKDFVEWRIEELLAQGARYVVVAEKNAQTATMPLASLTAFSSAPRIGATL